MSDSNADELAGTGLYGTTAGNTLALNLSGGGEKADKSQLNIIGFAQSLTTVARSVDSSDMAATSATHALQQSSDVLIGSCGGTATYSLTYDDATGVFNGGMTFANYDDCNGGALSGPVTVSGSLNLSTLELEIFTFKLDDLQATSDLGSEVISGTIVIQQTGAFSYQATCSMLYQINSNATCKLENFRVTFDESISPAVITITGRAYHPDHGYVDFVTTAPLRIYYYDDYPNSGVIELRGADGSSGEATLGVVTFNTSNSYVVDVDSNGDGTVDKSLSCSWDPDLCL